MIPASPLPEMNTKFDWAGRLSLDAIRDHTKTSDVIGVTDEQLRLYREAAIEAAEQYTGLYLAGIKTVTEPIEGPSSARPGRANYTFRLQHPVADGVVYLYGGSGSENGVFHVPVGTRKVKVPIRTGFIDTSNCCNPCSSHHLNAGMWAAYKAGFASPEEIPALVILGCMQFIAWVVEHPGDEILTVRNRRDARSEGAQGTNSIVLASGAMESWRILDSDII